MLSLAAVLSREVPHRHWSKDIQFLEALAVLEALRAFSPRWHRPGMVVLYVDNTNVKHGLRSGWSRDPLTQTLLREIFGLCHITLRPVCIASVDNHLADLLSCRHFRTIQAQFPWVHHLLFPHTSKAHLSPSPKPLLAQPPQLLTSGEAWSNPAVKEVPASLTGVMGPNAQEAGRSLVHMEGAQVLEI
ncbi:hypothetical protein NDA18_003307 [Ustilago nuda]|nr:hypothetical protein NDA18_003307 [Ustilago nuda]